MLVIRCAKSACAVWLGCVSERELREGDRARGCFVRGKARVVFTSERIDDWWTWLPSCASEGAIGRKDRAPVGI